MSRGPKDLRDLICVSRLTFRESDDEVYLSDEEKGVGDWDEISLGSSGSCDSQLGSSSARKVGQTPDSGCVTNGGSPFKDEELKLDLTSLKHKKRSKKKKKKALDPDIPKMPFPKPPPLPPVRSVSGSDSGQDVPITPTPPPQAAKPKHTVARYVGTKSIKQDKHTAPPVQEVTEDVDEESAPVSSSRLRNPLTYRVQASDSETGNYDTMLNYMDATVVSGWLTRANKNVSEVAVYIAEDDNFVQFAHFWLSEFPDTQKREIFELEIEILREELGFAFAVGRDEGKVSQRDISNLIGAIFREYPVKLLSARGGFLFLDYLDTVTSGRTQKYKQLLSDVKCSTKNRQFAQWLLATRSFALVSMWCAIVNFYRNLLGRHSRTAGGTAPEVPSAYKSVHQKRFFQALRHGYTDVVHYLNVGQCLDFNMIDSHERTLIFTAVMHNQPKVLHYLITRVSYDGLSCLLIL